uniref:Topoisomerase 2-associated protein PAT1 n=1 Tax=Musca domestica TaxID=7370 RepID=T1PDJ1_MUSDO
MVAQWKAINDNYKNLEGYKRVAWPPANEERVVREFTPQPHAQYTAPLYAPQAQEQNQPQQHQQQYQPNAAVPSTQQQYQQQQPKQYSPQPQYQGQGPVGNQYNQYQQPQQPQQPYQQPTTWVQEQHLPQPYKPPTQQAQYQQPQQQQQQQPQYQASSYQPTPQYQASSYQPQQAPLNNQYQTPYQNQYVSQPNQQQFNSYSQPQQQQQPPQQNVQNVSHGSDQLDNLKQHDQRGASPGIITLRKEAPISQAPAPVYTSQPAAVSFQGDDDLSGGSKLRGDLKWPPPEYKEAAARENEERRQLALGPVCRPRKVNRDYSSFFAKNALSHHYPSYKVPPGTQHVTY